MRYCSAFTSTLRRVAQSCTSTRDKLSLRSSWLNIWMLISNTSPFLTLHFTHDVHSEFCVLTNYWPSRRHHVRDLSDTTHNVALNIDFPTCVGLDNLSRNDEYWRTRPCKTSTYPCGSDSSWKSHSYGNLRDLKARPSKIPHYSIIVFFFLIVVRQKPSLIFWTEGTYRQILVCDVDPVYVDDTNKVNYYNPSASFTSSATVSRRVASNRVTSRLSHRCLHSSPHLPRTVTVYQGLLTLDPECNLYDASFFLTTPTPRRIPPLTNISADLQDRATRVVGLATGSLRWPAQADINHHHEKPSKSTTSANTAHLVHVSEWPSKISGCQRRCAPAANTYKLSRGCVPTPSTHQSSTYIDISRNKVSKCTVCFTPSPKKRNPMFQLVGGILAPHPGPECTQLTPASNQKWGWWKTRTVPTPSDKLNDLWRHPSLCSRTAVKNRHVFPCLIQSLAVVGGSPFLWVAPTRSESYCYPSTAFLLSNIMSPVDSSLQKRSEHVTNVCQYIIQEALFGCLPLRFSRNLSEKIHRTSSRIVTWS